MITLPSPRRAQLRAFWLVQSACAAFLAMIVGVVAGRRYMLLGIFFGLLMALPGLWRPHAISGFYRAWDRWAERYALWARMLLLRICYYVVFAAVGCAGSIIRRDPKSRSLWMPRTTLSPDAYLSQYDLTLPGVSRSWAAGYLVWAYKSGNIWACCLLPFLILIAALETQRGKAHPASIYTLF
jgi:hypothetical protein